ncbi:MAG: efflux transporter outer membrane subunit [Geopsychrobacter sp.]|nr:efflux transporter outer membrane subunit [Geopsychrobacter sp.]
MLKLLIYCWILPLTLLGCSLHQPLQMEPPISQTSRYVERTGEQATPSLERWWLSFHDPQLNQLMDQLFTHNLQLEEAFARTEQAQSALRIAASARLPTINLGGQGSRELVPGFIGNSYALNYRFSAQSSFELDLWGKLKNRRQAALKQAEAGKNQLETLYLSLSAQLADLYYFSVEQRSQIRLLNQTINSYQETLQRIEDRYRQGLTSALELYQARQNLTTAKAGRPNLEKNLASAEHGISNLLGHVPTRGISGTLTKLPTFAEQFPAGIPADLLQRRPDILTLFNQLQSADAELAAAIADRLPSLNLAANYGFLQNDFGIGTLTGSFWQLLIQPAVPLMDGGRRRAEVARNRALVRERIAGYRQGVLVALREVEDALSANQKGDERLKLLTSSLAAAKASRKLRFNNYLRGLNDYLPVLSSERVVLQAKNELVATRRQLISDRITLARSLGGAWMETEIHQRFSAKKEPNSHEQ